MRLHPLPLVLVLAACQSVVPEARDPLPGQVRPASAELPTELPIARAPFDHVQANWKQRLDQPYVYIEARGDYRLFGGVLERVFAAAAQQGLEISGPPFALFYDDPGKVEVSELRMRACVPVPERATVREPLAFDALESTTVVYAYVGGPYPQVQRAYPGVHAYLAQLDWIENGPVREIYLRDPSSVTDFADLVTEVQVPAARRP
jgi:effector-binding domain-containing protein